MYIHVSIYIYACIYIHEQICAYVIIFLSLYKHLLSTELVTVSFVFLSLYTNVHIPSHIHRDKCTHTHKCFLNILSRFNFTSLSPSCTTRSCHCLVLSSAACIPARVCLFLTLTQSSFQSTTILFSCSTTHSLPPLSLSA